MAGKFVSIEGIDGSGKSTLIRGLRSAFPNALFVKEPGTTLVGKSIRHILLNSAEPLEKMSEFFLFVASFIETSAKIVRPRVYEGDLVIADRWLYSAKAYQEFAFGHHNDEKSTIDKLCDMGDVMHPHLNIILDLPFDVAMERASASVKSKLDDRGENYFRLVHLYYQTECPGILVDATMKPGELLEHVVSLIKDNN